MMAANLRADAQGGLFAADLAILQLQNTLGTPTGDHGPARLLERATRYRDLAFRTI